MALGRTRRRLRRAGDALKHHYLLALLAIVASALLLAVYFGFEEVRSEQLWGNVIAEGIAGCWIFVLVYIFLVRQGIIGTGQPKESPVAGFHRTHQDVDWSGEISRAKRIDVFV